jgi:hypothetical protein
MTQRRAQELLTIEYQSSIAQEIREEISGHCARAQAIFSIVIIEYRAKNERKKRIAQLLLQSFKPA